MNKRQKKQKTDAEEKIDAEENKKLLLQMLQSESIKKKKDKQLQEELEKIKPSSQADGVVYILSDSSDNDEDEDEEVSEWARIGIFIMAVKIAVLETNHIEDSDKRVETMYDKVLEFIEDTPLPKMYPELPPVGVTKDLYYQIISYANCKLQI